MQEFHALPEKKGSARKVGSARKAGSARKIWHCKKSRFLCEKLNLHKSGLCLKSWLCKKCHSHGKLALQEKQAL
jgi:hypothetical protein